MRFRRKRTGRMAASVLFAAASLLLCVQQSAAMEKYAVVPLRIIYPGEVISAQDLDEVLVTNPNLAGGYAESIAQVAGYISNRTLLPGRTVPTGSLREPYAIKRGTSVRLNFTIGNMLISASGSPLQDAAIGDVIKVRNLDSGVIVSGTVMADGSIQVVAR